MQEQFSFWFKHILKVSTKGLGVAKLRHKPFHFHSTRYSVLLGGQGPRGIIKKLEPLYTLLAVEIELHTGTSDQ